MTSEPSSSSLPLVPLDVQTANKDNDWESFILSDFWNEEGKHDVPSEMQMYCELGLNEEDKAKENRRDETDLGGRNNIDQS